MYHKGLAIASFVSLIAYSFTVLQPKDNASVRIVKLADQCFATRNANTAGDGSSASKQSDDRCAGMSLAVNVQGTSLTAYENPRSCKRYSGGQFRRNSSICLLVST